MSKLTTLNAYKPMDIDDLESASPDTVFEKLDSLESWRCQIKINNQDTSYLVGKKEGHTKNSYQLYHPPTDENNQGYAGRIDANKYNSPAIVAFIPACNDNEEEKEKPITQINELTVTKRKSIDELDKVLDELRSELTGHDWTEIDRPRTNFDEWWNAVLQLLNYYDDEYNNPHFQITAEFLKGSVMHAIARYPGGAEKLLSSASMRLDRLEDTEDHNRSYISPFGLEQLLLDYASDHL